VGQGNRFWFRNTAAGRKPVARKSNEHPGKELDRRDEEPLGSAFDSAEILSGADNPDRDFSEIGSANGRDSDEVSRNFDGSRGDSDKKPLKPPPPRFSWICAFFTIFFFILAGLAFFQFFVIKTLSGDDYDFYRTNLCRYVLKNDCDGPTTPQSSDGHAALIGDPVLADEHVLSAWTTQNPPAFVLQNKIEALDINYSVLSIPYLNTGNTLLGLYERNQTQNPNSVTPSGRNIEAGVHFLLAGANGDFDARELYVKLNLSLAQADRAKRAFAELHVLNGAEGYFRLGQIYLHNPAQEFWNEGYPFSSPPKFAPETLDSHAFNNDFLTSSPQYDKAYMAMHKSVLCNYTYALQWRGYISRQGNFSRSREEALQRDAQAELMFVANNTKGGISDHCEGKTFKQRINQLTDPRVIWRFVSDRQAWPSMQQLVDNIQLDEPRFQQWIGQLINESYEIYGFDQQYPQAPYNQSYPPRDSAAGSKYYRESPGAGSGSTVLEDADEKERRDRLECADRSRAALKTAEGLLAIGNVREAKRLFEQALSEGRKCGAASAEEAQKRLQALNLTCEYDDESLARISRGVESMKQDPLDEPWTEDALGDVIKLRARQQALKAHGYYDGRIDGRYGPNTSNAVRHFQREFGFEETGDLTAIETVYLICSAAQTRRDPPSMNTLGVMYLVGLGTVQDTDAGLRWLKNAAGDNASGGYNVSRPDSNAMFNLATAYGLGTVTSSYRLCGIPESFGIADSYLERSAAVGHPMAARLVAKYGALSPSERWHKIRNEFMSDGFYKDELTSMTEACTPNP